MLSTYHITLNILKRNWFLINHRYIIELKPKSHAKKRSHSVKPSNIQKVPHITTSQKWIIKVFVDLQPKPPTYHNCVNRGTHLLLTIIDKVWGPCNILQPTVTTRKDQGNSRYIFPFGCVCHEGHIYPNVAVASWECQAQNSSLHETNFLLR